MRYLVGVGNYSMFDDSIGIRVIEYIEERKLDQDFRAIDLSSNLLNIFSYLVPETEKILIVDAFKSDKNPGDFSFMRLDDVKTNKVYGNFSTHEGDILKVLELAKSAGYPIPFIELMGITPVEIKNEFGLSQALTDRLPEYVKTAIERIHI